MPGGQPHLKDKDAGRLRVLLPKPPGHLRGFPFTASGSRATLPAQPPEQTRSPKSEFSSRAPPGEFTFPLRGRVVSDERVRGRWQQTFGAGAGVSTAHPAARTQEKKKAREHRGLIKAKTQDHPLEVLTIPGRVLQGTSKPPKLQRKEIPVESYSKSPRRWSAKGTAVFQDTACAKIHHAQSGTSCPDFLAGRARGFSYRSTSSHSICN